MCQHIFWYKFADNLEEPAASIFRVEEESGVTLVTIPVNYVNLILNIPLHYLTIKLFL
jgi:hypothetical protein